MARSRTTSLLDARRTADTPLICGVRQGPRTTVKHGREGKGMSVIPSNFNHDRWMILSRSLSTQRLIVEECLKYVPFPRLYLAPAPVADDDTFV
jgi:hypothetical protein